MLITALPPSPRAISAGIVPHRAWRQCRAALLEALSAGPATIALLGEAGTGKSWLLRHLETILRKHGRAVTLLRQGDLPWHLVPGAVLLIDEASRLGPQALAALAAQRSAFVILADLPQFGEALARQASPPRTVRLPPLEPDQVGDFVAQWLPLIGRDPRGITADGITRLALHTGGTPRLITRLLNAAFAFGPDQTLITAALIDEVATLRLDGGATLAGDRPPAKPAPPVQAAPRRKRAGPAAAFAALAAAVVIMLRPSDTAPPQAVKLPAPPIEAASVPPPSRALATPVQVVQAALPEPTVPNAPPRTARPPPVALADPALPSLLKTPLPAVPAVPAVTPVAEPILIPARQPPIEAAQPGPDMADAGPGLVLVAHRGDTLRDLYASLYRGVEAPPFEVVVAFNPKPVVAGSVVIFPAPRGGWPRK